MHKFTQKRLCAGLMKDGDWTNICIFPLNYHKSNHILEHLHFLFSLDSKLKNLNRFPNFLKEHLQLGMTFVQNCPYLHQLKITYTLNGKGWKIHDLFITLDFNLKFLLIDLEKLKLLQLHTVKITIRKPSQPQHLKPFPSKNKEK